MKLILSGEKRVLKVCIKMVVFLLNTVSYLNIKSTKYDEIFDRILKTKLKCAQKSLIVVIKSQNYLNKKLKLNLTNFIFHTDVRYVNLISNNEAKIYTFYVIRMFSSTAHRVKLI